MSSWQTFFAEGIKHFRRQEIDEALQSFDQAVSLANDRSYALYDSRASAYEKKNRLEDALRDAEKTIDIAPKQWHGYLRSARLFAALGQNDAALRMCSSALERLGDDSKHEARRREVMVVRWRLDPMSECPFAGMPVELLSTIFKFSNNPVVVSHVCRQWREVVLPQSTLWRSLDLEAPAKKAILKIREWHKRSRGRIVELNIRDSLVVEIFPAMSYQRRHNPGAPALYGELFVTLRHLDWTKIKECHIEGVDAEEFLFKLSGGTPFQHMEILSASCVYPHDVRFGYHPYLAKHPWENLRAFSITNAGCNWMQLSTSMRHLSSFEWKPYSGDFAQFHLFLQANPGLEKLVIESANLEIQHPGPQTAPDLLTLVHLRHLELSGDFPFHVQSGNFSLPSLRILRMTGLKNAVSFLSELVKDEGTSFAELVELTARSCALGPPAQVLISVLLRAPKLETLNCTDDTVNDIAESLTKPCMALLRRDPTSEEFVPTALPILCPALSVLDLSQSADLKTGPVTQIVKERIALATSQVGGVYQLPGHDGDRMVSCIRVLKVDECPHLEVELFPWLQNNVPEFSSRFCCRYEFRRRR